MMEDLVSWPVGEPATLRQQTVATLREALLNDVFKPGEQLVERKLADLTGVSRTSIREALSQLEAEGLVTRVSGKGMIVTRLSEDEALRVYEARAILESAIARLFVQRATDDEVDELAGRIAEAEATNGPDRARLHAEKLDAISDLIMEGARNEIMRQMASVLRARVTYLRTVTSRVASVERRRETMVLLKGILDAFRTRNSDLAERLTRAYVERSAAFATAVLRDLGRDEGHLLERDEMEPRG
jgi:GntR family transcriptional regulator, trigonelline degradation regulator